MPGLPNEVNSHHLTDEGEPGKLVQQLDLLLPPDQRQVDDRATLLTLVEPKGLDLVALALDAKRREWRAGCVRSLDDLGGRDDLARSGTLHEAGGEVHGVTEQRVAAPARRAEVSREGQPAVRPEVDIQAGEPGGSRTQRFDERPVVVVGGDRCAGAHEHLDSIGIRVDRQYVSARSLRVNGQLTRDGRQDVERSVEPAVGDHFVHSGCAHEADGNAPMATLGIEGASDRRDAR